EDEPLLLPSALMAAQREQEPLRGLAVIEEMLRDAQCATALERLLVQLHVKSGLLIYKKDQSCHQGPNTRSWTIVERNETKIRLHSEKYQMAWDALRRLGGGDPDKVGWRILRQEDIRCMEDSEQLLRDADKRKAQAERRLRREAELRELGELAPIRPEDEDTEAERAAHRGENLRQVSWIWTSGATAGTDEDLENALRIEWSKAYVRTRRWREETQMLEEEVRRLPVSLEFRASQWEEPVKAVPIEELEVEDAQGMIAYGIKQARMYHDIAAHVDGTMTEVKKGRGKRQRTLEEEYPDDKVIDVDGPPENTEDVEDATEDGPDSEDEWVLSDLRGDVPSDEEFILGGGADDD
ncbi:hypothetical protein FB451DRAFT_1042930, partial [Mycena latifolia]